MNNPLTITILKFLKERKSACSIVDLVTLCDLDFISIIEKDSPADIIVFYKNFFIMNALYQIQKDIQTEGFFLSIFPLEVTLERSSSTNSCANSPCANYLTERDVKLASYYLDWSNLNDITIEDIDTLFLSFWQKYSALNNIDAALATLEVERNTPWCAIRQSYLKKITISHPDKGGTTEDFIATREAYEVLRHLQ